MAWPNSTKTPRIVKRRYGPAGIASGGEIDPLSPFAFDALVLIEVATGEVEISVITWDRTDIFWDNTTITWD